MAYHPHTYYSFGAYRPGEIDRVISILERKGIEYEIFQDEKLWDYIIAYKKDHYNVPVSYTTDTLPLAYLLVRVPHSERPKLDDECKRHGLYHYHRNESVEF